MKQRAKKTLLKINPYVPGRPIEEVKRELGLKEVIKLASNENPYSPSPNVLKAMREALKSVNRYPDGGCYDLRQEVTKMFRVAPEQVVFGNGSDEVIVLAIRAFVHPGEEVIVAKPSFLIYELASHIEGAKVRSIPLRPDFKYDLQGMKKVVTKKTKIIFLGNPDNPSGQYLTQKEVESFLKGLPKDILIFMDEAYFEYVRAKDYVDSLRLLKQYPNILVARTFSKIYGLAGLRIGYGISSPEVIDILNRVRDPFNVNSVAQAAAVACLKDCAYYQNILSEINEQRQYIYENLRELDQEYVESFTNFVLIKVDGGGHAMAQALLKKGVIIRDMSAWGLSEYIRVSIGTPNENKKFIKALKDIL